MIVELFLPGDPVAKGRPRARVIAGHASLYTPAETRKFENLVKLAAAAAMKTAPVTVPVQVIATFFLQIPASWSGKQQARAEAGEVRPAKRPDLDNLAKSVTDGMNGVVYSDDALICRMLISKHYARKPGVQILVVAI